MTCRSGVVGPERPRAVFLLVGALLTFAALLGVWIALAGQFDVQDLVGGAGTSVVAVTAGFFVSQRGRALPSLRLGDVRILVKLPVQLMVETWQVFAAAARRLTGETGPVGTWSTVAVDTDAGGWPAARRDAVLTVLMSASPNTIVVDIDAETGTALIHRLVGGAREQAPAAPGGSAGKANGAR